MITLPDYQILARIHESQNSIVYRAYSQLENRLVILKLLNLDYPTPAELDRFKQEYELTRSFQLTGIVSAFQWGDRFSDGN